MPVVAHDQTLGVAVFTQCLFLQLAIGCPGLALLQAVALVAGDFAVQVVALITQ
ncbi:hypothetical protein D3C84_723730 [compost metagenome]